MLKRNLAKKTEANRDFFERAMFRIGSVPSLIAHSIIFAFSFSLYFFGVSMDHILLVVTTIVSLEAIYLALFIQMAVNKNTESLEEVEEDLDEIEKDIDDIQEDIDEIEKDDVEDVNRDNQNKVVLEKIEKQLQNLIAEIDHIKKN